MDSHDLNNNEHLIIIQSIRTGPTTILVLNYVHMYMTRISFTIPRVTQIFTAGKLPGVKYQWSENKGLFERVGRGCSTTTQSTLTEGPSARAIASDNLLQLVRFCKSELTP